MDAHRVYHDVESLSSLTGQTWQVGVLPPPKVTLGGEAIFLKIFKNTCRMTMIRCALESPDLGQPFKYLGRYHITHKKIFRAT